LTIVTITLQLTFKGVIIIMKIKFCIYEEIERMKGKIVVVQ